MSTSTATTFPATPGSFASLDGRITRALQVLRQARRFSELSPTPEAVQLTIRAEENLNALLDYRYSVRHRGD